MRRVLIIFAGFVAISGIVSANLWLKLRTERQLTADLHAQLTEAKNMLSRVATPAGPPVAVEPPPVLTAAAIPGSKRDSPPAKFPPLGMPVAGVNQGSDPLQKPEYSEARLAQQRIRVARSISGLAEELGLSEKEAERLIDLLAESGLNRESASRLSIGADGQPDRQRSLLRQQELQRQQEESIAALLGTARYAQWQQYQKTALERREATSMGTQLAEAGQPLSSAQQKSLVTAVIAERERTREERERLARSINPADPQANAKLEEQAATIQEESNRRILEAVGSSLDARQIKTLREQFEANAAMNRATSALQRGR